MADFVPKVGKIIAPEDSPFRDAIHVAVAPVEASMYLLPGQRVGLQQDGRAGHVDKPIGIVDPFLEYPVLPGQKFYLFIFPGTTTNLRHVYFHEAFAYKPEKE